MTDLAASMGCSRIDISPERLAIWLLTAVITYVFIVEPLLLGPSAHANLSATINQDAAAANPINQLFWAVCFAGTCYIGLRRRSRILSYLILLWPLLLYLTCSAAGILWSVSPEIVVR